MDVQSAQQASTPRYRADTASLAHRDEVRAARRDEVESETSDVRRAKQSDPTLVSMQIGSVTPDRGNRVDQFA